MEQEQQFLAFSYIAPPQSKNIHPFWFSERKKLKFLNSSGILSFLTSQFECEQPKGSIQSCFFLNSQGWGGGCWFF